MNFIHCFIGNANLIKMIILKDYQFYFIRFIAYKQCVTVSVQMKPELWDSPIVPMFIFSGVTMLVSLLSVCKCS